MLMLCTVQQFTAGGQVGEQVAPRGEERRSSPGKLDWALLALHNGLLEVCGCGGRQ